jgi:hypothetical protein
MPLVSCCTRAGLNASFPVAFSFRWADRNSVRRRPAIRARNLPVSLNALWRPLEACQRSQIASPPFLRFLSVSPPSFLQLQPELDKAADQICPRCLAIFLNGSLSVFALRRIAKLVRFRALAMVSTLFALRTSARSSWSRSGIQGRRGVPVICPSPPSRGDRSVIVCRQANAVPRLKRAMRLPFAYTDYRRACPAQLLPICMQLSAFCRWRSDRFIRPASCLQPSTRRILAVQG